MRRAAGFNSEENRQNGPPVPNLPGMGLSTTLAPRPRAQTLRFVNGYPIAEDVELTVDPLSRSFNRTGWVPDLGPTPPFALHEAGGRAQQAPRHGSAAPEPSSVGGRAGGVPNWIAFDGKVLRFGAYFREEVPNSALETWRVRKVAIRYYLENDQVEIVEIREPNSGLPQGTLLKRISAVKDDGSPLRSSDLRVGGSVTLYRRTYHLVSADGPTRTFYSERGEEQPPDETFPEGPYDQHRKAMALEASRARLAAQRPPGGGSPTPGGGSGGPPLPADLDPLLPVTSPRGPGAVFDTCPPLKPPDVEARDNAVLRFLAAWDNTGATFGEVLPFALSYHVADGTVEVREVARRNCGRDPFPLLLRRGRLPKTLPPVLGRPMSPGTRRALAIPYYDWRDLHLGAVVNVYGRPLLLYDCDEPTRTWLRKNVPGITEGQVTSIPVDFDPFGPKRPPLSIPPNVSGIGSEEDSLQNVLRLVPRPPARSYTDYLENWNKVLRFEAAMVPLGPGRPLTGPNDAERSFILSYHLLDRTLSIWEPKRENSGMEQGLFLERTKVNNPATGMPYTETDMQVGAVLEIFGRGFHLRGAETATLVFMESQAYRFPWADYDKVLAKLSSWLAQYPTELPDRLQSEMLGADTQGSGYIGKYRLHAILSSLGSDLSPHEVITLVRHLGADRQGLLVEQLLAALGLAPPPTLAPPSPPEPEPAAPPQPPQPPFPAAGLLHPAWPPQRRLPWVPQPAAATTPRRGGAAAAAIGGLYRGLGPTPGHPRVDPPPQSVPASSYEMPYGAKFPGWGGGLQRSGPGSGSAHEAAGGGDDRRHVRDTADRSWEGFHLTQGAATSGVGGSAGGGVLGSTPKLAWSVASQPPHEPQGPGPEGPAAYPAGSERGSQQDVGSQWGLSQYGSQQGVGGGSWRGGGLTPQLPGSHAHSNSQTGSGMAGGSRPASISGSQPATPPAPQQEQPPAAGSRPGGGAFLTSGYKQPSFMWQTTNMAIGGVGHSASFQRR